MCAPQSITFLVVAALLTDFTIPASAGQHLVSLPVIDAALTNQGQLIGRLHGPSDQRIAGAIVQLSQDGTLIAQVKSDAEGRFVFSRVRTGTYELSSAGGLRQVRVWTSPAAPPAARQPLVLPLDESAPVKQTARRANQVELVSWSDPATSIGESHLSGSPSPIPVAESHLTPLPPSFSESSPVTINDGPFAMFGGYEDECVPLSPYVEMGGPTHYVEMGGPTHAGTSCPPTHYPMGPTIGQVVTATAVISGVALGVVGIYEAVKDDDVNRPASP